MINNNKAESYDCASENTKIINSPGNEYKSEITSNTEEDIDVIPSGKLIFFRLLASAEHCGSETQRYCQMFFHFL